MGAHAAFVSTTLIVVGGVSKLGAGCSTQGALDEQDVLRLDAGVVAEPRMSFFTTKAFSNQGSGDSG